MCVCVCSFDISAVIGPTRPFPPPQPTPTLTRIPITKRGRARAPTLPRAAAAARAACSEYFWDTAAALSLARHLHRGAHKRSGLDPPAVVPCGGVKVARGEHIHFGGGSKSMAPTLISKVVTKPSIKFSFPGREGLELKPIAGHISSQSRASAVVAEDKTDNGHGQLFHKWLPTAARCSGGCCINKAGQLTIKNPNINLIKLRILRSQHNMSK